MTKDIIEIFTDGSCLGNPGPGGWAALLRYGAQEKKISGSDPSTTNNRMELQAAIEALASLNRPSVVQLTTDSQYLRMGMTQWVKGWQAKGWRRSGNQPVKNDDLWRRLVELDNQHQISWHWVKAHNGNADNECVDKMANEAAHRCAESQ